MWPSWPKTVHPADVDKGGGALQTPLPSGFLAKSLEQLFGRGGNFFLWEQGPP